jgi:hypothetical protein
MGKIFSGSYLPMVSLNKKIQKCIFGDFFVPSANILTQNEFSAFNNVAIQDIY